MNPSTVSFLVWTAFMIFVLGGLVWTARRSRVVQDKAEDVASKALPEIGGIAERQHIQRFGRAATDAPGTNGQGSWYPEVKKRVAKHA